jgi:hypothetical protein
MRPGDTLNLVSTCETAAGVAVTGAAAGYAFTTLKDGAALAIGVTTTEISGGRYKHAVVLPSSKGVVALFPTNSTNIVWPAEWEFVLESNDLDSVYAASVRPVVNATATGAPAVDVPLTFDANRRHDCTVSVVDSTGAVVDLSGYNNWRFTVWDKNHTGGTFLYQLTGAAFGSNLGVVSWTVPETAAFFAQIDAAIAAGTDPVTLYYDMIADSAATLANTRRVFGGAITLRRYEGAA